MSSTIDLMEARVGSDWGRIRIYVDLGYIVAYEHEMEVTNLVNIDVALLELRVSMRAILRQLTTRNCIHHMILLLYIHC